MPEYEGGRLDVSGVAPVRQRPGKHKRKRLLADLQVVLLALVVLAALVVAGWFLLSRLGGEATGQIHSGQSDKITAVDVGTDKGHPNDSRELEPGAAEKLDYIHAHPELYPQRLVELAEGNHETIDFVYRYPELGGTHQEIDLSGEVQAGEVPLLMQWDTRWGYEEYGDGLMCYTGCGPTCLSMAAIYLTGNTKITPLAVAEYSEGSGYYFDGTGTAWLLMSEGCEGFGLRSEEISLHDTYFYRALDQGKVIVCAMGPGDFTDEGHFIVISGYAGEKFVVRDPNSIYNSTRLWSFEELEGQIKGVWALRKR